MTQERRHMTEARRIKTGQQKAHKQEGSNSMSAFHIR
jgi:hypothetical protein